MRILLLGGTAESHLLATQLARRRHDVEYSLAGRTSNPAHPPGCRIRSGGFGAVAGLRRHLEQNAVQLLVDGTHPYAVQISRNAHAAAAASGTPLWALRRPPWRNDGSGRQRSCRDWATLHAALRDFRRPFLTIPGEVLSNLSLLPPWPHQLWILRRLEGAAVPPPRLPANVRILRGFPASQAAREERLLRRLGVDVLVCRNSGGQRARAKILAARRLRLPVLMLRRPSLPKAARRFSSVGALLSALPSLQEKQRPRSYS